MSDTPSSRRPKVKAYHLTPEQLWVAYLETPINGWFAKLATTRLDMLREAAKREQQRSDGDDA